MSQVTSPPAAAGTRAAAIVWHRPLLWLAAAMAVLAVVSAVGVVIDPRVLLGAPIWAKPLKFALSIGIYCVTLAWLIGLLPRWRRTAWWAGTIAAIFLSIEIVVIVGAVIAGTTSHFNVASPLHSAIWGLMAVSIVIVWAAALPIVLLLWRTDLGDAARALAIRAGFVIALIGMALAFLMTSPTAAQISDFQGIAGAHTVGLADGGPGLPILGWSTVGGDLRIPHFVGMHALQVIPLAAIALELVARRWRVLRPAAVRRQIVWVVIAAYLGTLALLTAQALVGESIVQPSPLVFSLAASLAGASLVAVAVILGRAARDAIGPESVSTQAGLSA